MKKQNCMCSCSKKTVYTLENVSIKFITKGTVTWTLTTPGETYSFSGDVTDKNLKFSFSLPDENVLLSIRYDNLEFEKCVENAQLVLTSGQRNVSGKHSVSIDNLSLKEVLSLNIDVVGEEVHPMILEYTTKKDNQTIKLLLSGDTATHLNALVDWGDGSPIQTVTSAYPTHEYAKSGVYEVMISGTVPRIVSFDLSVSEKQYLTGIKSWGKLGGLISMNYAFLECKNLRGELPNDDYGCFENVTDFGYCFCCCSGLTLIPESLFSNCPNVTDFGFCFCGCSGLTSIPEGLFANCSNVTDFSGCFNYSYGLTGSIPENLFANCPNVTDFNHCFDVCAGLTGSIPENLFANCPNVTDFNHCFSGCRGLTGSIPENLFANCPNVTNFYACFKGCSGLTGSIPANLFANCPNVTDFNHCFSGCAGLTGSISEGLFANCPNVTSFESCFFGCTGLTSIPEGLFANCPNVIDFEYCFSNCRGLTGNTPVDILEDGTRVELWERAGKEGYPNSIDGGYCFNGCTNLNKYSEIPSGWK